MRVISSLAGSSARREEAGAGAWYGLGEKLRWSWQADQSTRQFSTCCFFSGTGNKQGCLQALKEQSRFPTAPWNSTGLQTSQRIFSVLGCPLWGWNPSFLREDPWADDIPFIFWVTRHGCGSWIDCTSSPPTWSQFFLYNLHHKELFWYSSGDLQR